MAPARPSAAEIPNSSAGPRVAYSSPPTTFARKPATPTVVIESSACPEPWRRGGSSRCIDITLAIHSPEYPAPEMSRLAMIATGDTSTLHSPSETTYSTTEPANTTRSPTRGASRLAATIENTSAAAATDDDSATSGAPPPSSTIRSDRNVNPANTPTCASPTASRTRGSAAWIARASRIAPPRRPAVSVARPRSGTPPTTAAITRAMARNRRPAGQYPLCP